MTTATPGTNAMPVEQRTPLSARRLRHLEYHALAAGGLAVAAVAAAWLSVVYWAAGLYTWPFAAHGFRSWIVFGAQTLLFYLLVCTVGANVAASVRNSATRHLVAAHQPISGLVTVTAVLCSVPRWSDLATAWTHNTPDPLAAHWPLGLASFAPAVLAGLIGHAAAEYVEWVGFRLECAQREETDRGRDQASDTGGSKPMLWAVLPGPRDRQQ